MLSVFALINPSSLTLKLLGPQNSKAEAEGEAAPVTFTVAEAWDTPSGSLQASPLLLGAVAGSQSQTIYCHADYTD